MKINHWLDSFGQKLKTNKARRDVTKRHRPERNQLPAPVEKLEERVLLSVTTQDIDPDISDTNSPATGDVDPTSIDHHLIPGQSVTDLVTLNFEDETQIPAADIIFVVDESGSMGGEHAWISEMATDLEASLELQGITDNRFSLVGYLSEGSLFNMAPSEFTVKIYDTSGTLVDSATISPEYEDNSSGNSAFINAEFDLPADGTYYAVVETNELDQQGLVSIDAENYKSATAGATGDTWSVEDNYSASGAEVVESGDDDGTSYGSGSLSSAPRLEYDVDFEETGTYYVWVRGTAPSQYGDKVYVGLGSTEAEMGTFNSSRMEWEDSSTTFSVTSTGVQTLKLWMGEDGVIVDKIVLTKDSGFTPTGQGPTESTQNGSNHFLQNTSSQEFSFLLGDDTTTVTNSAITLNEVYQGTVVPEATDHTYTFSITSDDTEVLFESLAEETAYTWSLAGTSSGDVISGRGFDLADQLLSLDTDSYTLTVSALDHTAANYGFRLVDLTNNTTAITTGSSTTTTVDPVTETVAYTLAVTAGNQYYFNSTSWNGDSDARWRLVDDTGNVLFDNSLNDDQDLVTAAATGTYYLLVEGDPAETATTARSFSFTVEDLGTVASNSSALTFGTAVSSSLTTVGEQAHYTFTLTSDKLVYLDSLTNSSTLNWSLTDSTGTLVDKQALNDGNQVLHLAADSYTLTIDGAGTNTGSFNFNLFDVGASATTLTPDTAESGTLDPITESHLYQFSVTAGDKYSFDSTYSSGTADATWKLVDARGNVILSEAVGTDHGTLLFHEGGTYTLVVEGDEAGSGTVGYSIDVVSEGTDTSSTAPLNVGEVTTGTIATSGKQDLFSFTVGTAGLYYLDALVNNGPVRWSLSGSTSGTVVTNRDLSASNAAEVADADVVLDLAADTYTLTLDADTGVTGDYAFRLLDVDSAATSLSAATSTTIDGDSHTTHLYSLTATANDRFRFDLSGWEGSTDSRWRLMEDDGTVVASDSLAQGVGNVTLTAGGTYYLLLEGDVDETTVRRSATFEYHLQEVEATSALTLGSLATGDLTTAGDLHEYTFTGTAGQQLLLDFSDANTTDHWIQLRGPYGELLLDVNYDSGSSNITNQFETVTLSDSGAYQLLVGADNSSTGDYEFQLSAHDDLKFGHDVSGTLDTVSSREVFQFTGLKDQTFQLRMDVWGDASDLSYAAERLSTVGGTEDGYNAIDFGLELLDLRENASKHVILITDEDRDVHNQNVSLTNIVNLLDAQSIVLHSVINATINPPNTSDDALGLDGNTASDNIFFADGSGGYTTSASGSVSFDNPFGTTIANYITPTIDPNSYPSFENSGTVWDLNQLREGNTITESAATALSFSSAFVDVITDQVLEDSYSLALSKTGVDYSYELVELTEEYVSYDVTWTENGASHLFDLQFIRNGDTANPAGSIPVSLSTYYVEMIEESDFNTLYSDTFTLQSGTQALALDYTGLTFDTDTTGETNDAFELALVDSNGDSVVGTIMQGRDSFFNFTEGEVAPTIGGGATVTTDGTTGVSTVTVDVSHLAAGTELTLIARLINNDANTGTDNDISTTVKIDPVMTQLATSPIGSPSFVTTTEVANLTSATDPNSLTDVSSLVDIQHELTSFNDTSEILYTGLTMENLSGEMLRGPVLVGVTNLSDPSVSLLNTDGQLNNGIKYYEVGHLIVGDDWEANETLSGFSLQFHNPNQIEFDYDIVVYAAFNEAPVFDSTPVVEVVGGESYSYDAEATDPEGDTITYALVSGPTGMTVDSTTGEVDWSTTTNDQGAYSVVISATDEYGEVTEQSFTLSVVEAPPNQPPLFQSLPVVDAYAGFDYYYQAIASDPDGDTLAYSVVTGPTGMTIDSSSGLITWTDIPEALIGQNVSVTIEASDGNGGTIEQNFLISIHSDLGNTPPIIITTPNTGYVLPDGSSSQAIGDVSPTSIDLQLELGDGSVQPITLNYPEGDSLFTADIVIALDATASMQNDINWIPDMVEDLEAALLARGITNNRYSIVHFTGSTMVYGVSPAPSHVSIYGPDNELVHTAYVSAYKSGWAYVGDVELPSTGDYYAIVENDGWDAPEEYRFEVEKYQDTVTTKALTLNSTVTDLIDTRQEIHEYTFTLANDTRVELDVMETFPYYQWSLVTPTGQGVNNWELKYGQQILDLKSGSYSLLIEDTNFEFTPYQFRLNDLTNNVTTLTTGTSESGTMSDPNGTEVFKFNATAGDRYYFDAISWSGSGQATWRLVDPHGVTVFDRAVQEDEPTVSLQQTGDYYIILEGAPEDPAVTVNYEFNVSQVTDSSTALTLGSQTTGSIGVSGVTDSYTFTLASDDYVFFQPFSAASDTVWSLTSGGVDIVSSQAFSAGDKVQKLTAGDYAIEIAKTGGATGGYDFSLSKMSAATALTVDTQVDATLSPAQSVKLYNFTATAGDKYSFDSISWNGSSSARWALYDEVGTQLFDDVVGNDQATMTLTADGDYTVVVTGDPTDTATNPQFSFKVVDEGTATANTLSGTSLSLNSAVSGSISTLGEVDKFTFTLTGTTRIFLDAISKHSYHSSTEPEEMYWKLENEYETIIAQHYFYDSGENDFDNGAQFLKLAAGDYQLSVAIGAGDDEDTGNYSFQVLDLDDPTANLTVGTPYSGTLVTKRMMQSYQFDADAGDVLQFDNTAYSGTGARWYLIDSHNNVLFNHSLTTDQGGMVMPKNGTYTLLLEELVGASKTFTIEVDTGTVSGSGTALSFDTAVSSSISVASEVDTYSFSLTGEKLVLFDSQTNDANLQWSLSGPGGDRVTDQLFTTTSEPVWLAAGDYELTVSGVSSATGSYDFQLIDLSSATSISEGVLQDDSLSPGNSTDAYKISATAGDWLKLDISDISVAAQLQIYSARGEMFHDVLMSDGGGGPFEGDGAEFDMPETGDYYVLIRGPIAETATSNDYEFTLDLFYQPIPLTKSFSLNSSKTETISLAGEAHYYDFYLPINALVNFDSFTNNANITWSLQDENGTEVAGDNLAVGDEAVSLTAGNYQLVIDGVDNATGSYTFQLDNLLTEAAPLSPDDSSSQTVTLSDAKGSYVLQFQGASGEKYNFDAVSYDGSSSARWKLVDSSGTELFNKAITEDVTSHELTSSGSFWLIVEGDLTDSTTSPEFEFNFTQDTSGGGGGGGSYTLYGTSINLGQTYTGNIDEEETDLYNFTLSSDSLIYFDNLYYQSSSNDIVWTLKGAAGNYVVDRATTNTNAAHYTGNSTSLVFDLPAGGYNLEIFNEDDRRDENYAFQIIDLGASASTFTPGTPGTPTGTTVNGTLTPSRATDVYKMTVTAGQEYDFDALTTTYDANARWRLIAPDGEILFTENWGTDHDSYTFNDGGTYYLLIEGSDWDADTSISYSFKVDYVAQGTVPATALTLGTAYAGTLSSGTEVDEFEFTLASSTKVFFDSLTNNSDFQWTIEDSSSTVVVSSTSFTASDGNDVTDANLIKTLSADTYTLKIDSTNSATGDYEFRLVDFGSASTAITGGTTGTQQLLPGNNTDFYTLSVTAGERLYISSSFWSGSSQGQFRLVTSSGTVLKSGALNAAHTYDVLTTETLTVLVEGDVADDVSLRTYQLDIEAIDITSTSTITLDSNGASIETGNISVAGDIHEYQFTTSSTDMRFYFEWLGTNTDVKMQLKDSTGKTILTDDYVTESIRSKISTLTLDANETYSLLFSRGTSTTTGTFDFRVLDIDAQPELQFFELTSGEFSTSTERDLYHFEGQKGDRFMVRLNVWGTKDELQDNVGDILDYINNQSIYFGGVKEDGYAPISVSLHDHSLREHAAKQFVLITDEDRDINYPYLNNRDEIESGLLNAGYSLHTILDMQEALDTNDNPLLGVSGNNANSVAYVSDGDGDYYEDLASNFTFVADDSTDPADNPYSQYDESTHIQEDYVELSYNVGGSVWDINQMSNPEGGYSTSFTDAFVKAIELDVARKVEISLIPTDPTAPVQVLSPTIGTESITFDTIFTGDGNHHFFDMQFVRTWNNNFFLGSVPVTIQTKYFYDTDAIDADDDVLTYELIAGSEYGATIDSETGQLHWTPTTTGDYDFTVVVSDGFGGQDTQSWTVTVSDTTIPNNAPTFTSAGPFTIDSNRQFAFTLSGSDTDGDTLLYQLVDDPVNYPLPTGLDFDGVTGIVTWSPTNDQIGTHNILARLLDGHGGVATQVISITVEEPSGFTNSPPVITSTPPDDLTEGMPLANVGELYSYQMTAYDPEGDNIGFEVSYAPKGIAIHPSTGLMLWKPTADQLGDHQVILRVKDNLGGVSLQSFSIRVQETTGVPQITSTPTATFDKTTNSGVYNYSLVISDPDGVLNDVVDLALVNTDSGVSLPSTATLDANGEATVVLSFTLSTTGLYPIQIEVTDQDGNLVTQEYELQVYDSTLTNNAPVISTASTNRDVVQAGVLFVSRIIATDPDNDAITYSLLSNPTGMTIDADNGVITWQTSDADINDPLTPYQYQVRVTDARGAYTDSAVLDLDVALEMANAAPTITNSGVTTVAYLNSLYQIDLDATDPENDLLGWSLRAKPSGMTIDAETGVINWTPTAGDEGTYTVTAAVFDPYGGRDEITYTLTVQGVSSPPQITSLPGTEVRQGQTYSYQVTAYDPEGETMTFALVNPPTGMTINSSTGLVTWDTTGVTLDSYDVIVQVTDPQGQGTEQSYDLDVVTSSSVERPVFIGYAPSVRAYNGVAYSHDFDTHLDDNMTYRLIGTVPTGMSINSSTGLLTWTPNETTGTWHTVQVGASDGNAGTDDETIYAYSILVVGNNAPVLDSISNVSVTAGNQIARYVSYSDNNNDRVTWSLDPGAPSGMVLNANNGILTWLTTPADVSGTPYDVTVRITDPAGAEDTESFQVTVVADTTDPDVAVEVLSENVFQNSPVIIRVAATDDVAIDDIELKIDGVEVLLDSNNEYIFTPTSLSGHTLAVTATDVSGNSTTITENVTVLDPNNTSLPTATLNAITADEITTLTDIVGTINDSVAPTTVTWTLSLIGENATRELASGTGTQTAATLHSLDPTLLPNGVYTLKLTATNSGGQSTTATQQIVIDTGLNKVGNFAVSFLDLELPLANLPISVTRSYDTLRADEPGDFGYGWVMDITNTAISIEYPNGSSLAGQPFTDGTVVSITLQDGSTYSFTFQPQPEQYLFGTPLGDWYPAYTAHELFDGVKLIAGGGPYRKYGTGTDAKYINLETGNYYDPTSPEFGNAFVLQLRDGTEYTFNATTGKLSQIHDTLGNNLTFTENGIFHSAGRSIQFVRNYQGFITSIIDPAGQTIDYSYDTDGNLVSVTDREDATTQFVYYSGTNAPEHYLKEIIAPNGQVAAENLYDSNGILTEVKDAGTESVLIDYETTLTTTEQNNFPTAVRKEVLTDQVDEEWTTYFDAAGNKVAEVDPLGGTMTWTYSDQVTVYYAGPTLETFNGINLKTSETKVIGQVDGIGNSETDDITTEYYYWIDGNVMFQPPVFPELLEATTAMIITKTDPRGNETKQYLNKFGRLIRKLDERGNITYYKYQEEYKNEFGESFRTGHLTSIRDALNNSVGLGYDTVGNLNTVTDTFGNTSYFDYNAYGEVTNSTDSLGQQMLFVYDDYGNPIERHTIIGEIDDAQNGETDDRITYITYDYNGNTKTTTDHFGNTNSTTYNGSGQVDTETDQYGNVTKYLYDNRGLVVQTIYDYGTSYATTSEMTYDAKGREVYSTSAHQSGATTHGTYRIYDELDRVIETKTYSGMTITITDQGSGIYSATLATAGTLLRNSSSVYDANTGYLTSSTDSQGNVSSYEYNAYGQQTKVKRKYGTQPELVTEYVYDQYGNKIETIDPYGRSTYTVYDQLGRVIKTINSQNQEAITTYDSYGRAASRTSYDGNLTEYTYDSYGRQSEVKQTLGTTVLTTTYSYDAYGNQSEMVDPYGRKTTYTYDDFGRQTGSTYYPDYVGSPGTTYTTSTTYDSEGRVSAQVDVHGVKTTYVYNSLDQTTSMSVIVDEGLSSEETFTTSYEYDDYGRVTKTTDPLGKIMLNSYDDRGRLVSETQVVGNIDDGINLETDDVTTSRTYDVYGNVATETNGIGLTRSFEYDTDGRLIKVTLPPVADPNNGGTLTSPVYQYGYDDYGNMTTLTDPLGRVTTFAFGNEFNQTSRTLPITGLDETFAYDSLGRQYRHTDFEGNTVDQVFTEFGLLDELHYFDDTQDPDVDTPSETVEYTYDEFNRITTVLDERGTTTYTYNDQGQVTQIDSPEGILNYEYDDFNRRIKTTTGDPTVNIENEFNYTYDEFGRLETVTVIERNDTVLSTPEVTTYTYDAVGKLVQTDLANGVITTYSYNDLYQLTDLVHYDGSIAPANRIAEYNYTVRADGKKLSVDETYWDGGAAKTSDFTWVYDDLGRLVEEIHDDDQDNSLDYHAFYTFDLTGNRLKKEVDTDLNTTIDETTTYTYNNADQLLTETKIVGAVDSSVAVDDTYTVYTYDGTLQTGKAVYMKYDYDNVSGTKPTTDTTYEFNLQGRMSKVIIETWSGGSQISEEIVEYEYDHNGIRVETHHTEDTNNDGTLEVDETTTHLVDHDNFTGYAQTIEEVTYDNLAQAEKARRIYTLGHDIISQFTKNSTYTSGLNTVFLYDGHGSTRILTDMTAGIATYNSIKQIFKYDAYGQSLGFDANAALTSILYSGEWTDATIGRQYLRARFYDMQTGTFNRLDPFFGYLENPQSFHKYLYVHGDPVNHVDPTGLVAGGLTGLLKAIDVRIKAGAASAGAALQALRAAKTATELYKAVAQIGILLNTAYDTLNLFITVYDLLTFDPSDLVDIARQITEQIDFENVVGTAAVNMPRAVTIDLPIKLRGKLGVLFANDPTGKAAETMGILGAMMLGKAMGLEVRDIPVFYHGFDALLYEPRSERFMVVEAKGNSSKLSKSSRLQMSSKWISHRMDKMIQNGIGEDIPELKTHRDLYNRDLKAFWAMVVNLKVGKNGKDVDLSFQIRTHAKNNKIQYRDWDRKFRHKVDGDLR